MSQTKWTVLIILGTALPVFIAVTGMWNPLRWGMYIDSMRTTAPIRFYGQIVDEEGQPLEGARVSMRVLKHNWAFILSGDSPTRLKQYDLVTDAQGRFQLTGEIGRGIVVQQVTLHGYRFNPRIVGGGNWDVGFYFAGSGVGQRGPHNPDPQNPVSFEMVPVGRR